MKKFHPPKNRGEIFSPPTSSSNNKNTTTKLEPTKEVQDKQKDFKLELNEDYFQLSQSERDKLLVHLKPIRQEDQQAFWDEFTVLVTSKAKTDNPINNKVYYLRGMVKKYLADDFNFTDANERMVQRRLNRDHARHPPTLPARVPNPSSTHESEPPKDFFANIRKKTFSDE